jgi:ankyrin repeat protein
MGFKERALGRRKASTGERCEPRVDGKDRRTPLLWASRNSHEAVVALMLLKGADAESKDINDRTPQSYVIQKQTQGSLHFALLIQDFTHSIINRDCSPFRREEELAQHQ